MGVVDQRTRSCCKRAAMRSSVFFSFLVIAFLLIFRGAATGSALQTPALGLAETESSEQTDTGPAACGP